VLTVLINEVQKKKKTQHFKCYLSKTNAYKEDPHWFCVTGFLKGAGDHWLAEFVVRSRSGCLWCVVLLGFLLL